MSSALRDWIVFECVTKDSRDLSVIVFVSSVSTIPGSIVVTRILFLTDSSCLSPSLNAHTANLVAHYTLPAGKTTLPAIDDIFTIWPDFCAIM